MKTSPSNNGEYIAEIISPGVPTRRFTGKANINNTRIEFEGKDCKLLVDFISNNEIIATTDRTEKVRLPGHFFRTKMDYSNMRYYYERDIK